MSELAVSSWSLHHTLGPIYPELALHEGERHQEQPYGPGELSLLDLPACVAALGIRTLEVCHFHFARTDDAYLADLRAALAAADVRLLTLLIDAGDISAADPVARERDLSDTERWIAVAAALGTPRVRVAAGRSAPDADGRAVQASSAALTRLSVYARSQGVEAVTENWLTLAARPQTLLAIVNGMETPIKLCADFGNFPPETREADLEAILPRAVTVHAKADWPQSGVVDAEGFRRCLDLTRAAHFQGHYVVIFDEEGDEREGIRTLAGLIQPYLAPAVAV